MTKETPTKVVRRDMKLVYIIAIAVVGLVSPFFLSLKTQALHGQAIENMKESITLIQRTQETLKESNILLQANFEFYHGTK